MKMDKYRQHFLFSVYTLAPLLHSSMHTLICIIACLLLLLVDGQTPAGRCIYSLSLVTLIVGMWCWPWAENITSDRRLLFKFLSWRSSLNTLWSGWHGKNLSWTPRAVSHLFSDGCREVNSGEGGYFQRGVSPVTAKFAEVQISDRDIEESVKRPQWQKLRDRNLEMSHLWRRREME